MLALEGYRLLDLSRLGPGPLASRILADLGMDVIKVEEAAPRAGRERDVLTPMGRPPEEADRWLAYNSLARNTRSISLNLKDADAREAFYRLAAKADLVLEGYRPGVVKRLGVDYETLRSRNPRLVYCSLTGYGQTGPLRDVPGHDQQYSALAGATAVTGDREGNPVGTGVFLADFSGSLHAVIGMLTALMARERTGQGQYVDVAMVDGVLPFLSTFASKYFRDGVVPLQARRDALGRRLIHVRCKDGRYISCGNSEPHFWDAFCRAIGREDFIPYHAAFVASVGRDEAEPDPRQAELDASFPRVVEEIERVILTRTRDEWVEALTEAGSCVAPVLELDEAMAHPNMKARGLVWELPHPRFGVVKQPGSSVALSGTPAVFRSFAPQIGEHTVPLLREAGYTDEQIANLERRKAIRVWRPDPENS